MSILVMTQVWANSKCKGNELLMLLAIADHADDEGSAFPGVKRLAQKVRVTQRGAQQIIRRLEEKLELCVLRNNGVKTLTGHTNRYIICVQGVNYHAPLEKHGYVKLPDIGVNSGASLEDRGMNSGAPHGVNSGAPEPSVQPSVKEIEPSVKGEYVDSTQEKSIDAGELAEKIYPPTATIEDDPLTNIPDIMPMSMARGLGGLPPIQDKTKTPPLKELKKHPYVQAYLAAFPDDAQPILSLSKEKLADYLTQLSEGKYTTDELTALVQDKLKQGKTDYKFQFAVADIAGWRLKNKNTTPTPSKKKQEPEPDLTPAQEQERKENIAEMVKQGREALKQPIPYYKRKGA